MHGVCREWSCTYSVVRLEIEEGGGGSSLACCGCGCGCGCDGGSRKRHRHWPRAWQRVVFGLAFRRGGWVVMCCGGKRK